MAHSLEPPKLRPDSSTIHGPSGSILELLDRGGVMYHRISERGLVAEYPVKYQLGSGKAGHSYLIAVGDYLIQSPGGWYSEAGWNVAPAFASKQLLDFDSPVDAKCLFCHADNAKFTDADGRRLSGAPIAAIGCDRCHGPTADHVRHPSAKNIINPGKLKGAARDSVCVQCHLLGEARILNPGKELDDFHAGQDFADVVAVYVPKSEGGAFKAVSQVEQLSQSMCARATGGKLWCGSCHDPHGESGNRELAIKKVCVSCHASASLSKAGHPTPPGECVSCHMPRVSPSDIAHMAITDHRILRSSSESRVDTATGSQSLSAWAPPPEQFRARDLGLAELEFGSRIQQESTAADGAKLLDEIPQAQQNDDPAVLSARSAAFLSKGNVEQALSLSRRAVEKSPNSALYAVYLSMALDRKGDLAEAERQLNRAIDLDPSLQEAYVHLVDIYSREGSIAKQREAIDRYLRWNPQSIWFRLAKAALPEPTRQ